MSEFKYSRRMADTVCIGDVRIGSGLPIAVQSMTNTPTLDTAASAAQVLSIARAGADIVRLTAQGVAHAQNLGAIRAAVRDSGCGVPLVADIHFNPAAAFEAAKQVEKVRINPGNFVDPGRTFKKLEYTDEEYAAELQRIDDKLTPLLELLASRGAALRIGVNHGSLSDRIMSRYGDTPAGMAESAMEFLRVCRKRGFSNVVISIKASNVVVMTETVRRLVRAMDAEDMHFPLHLGVTEAGDGEDGRVKSAVGIGSLLADGIGDTIRVSLSEAPEAEIPVAREILKVIDDIAKEAPAQGSPPPGYDAAAPGSPAPVAGWDTTMAVGVDFDADHIPADAVVIDCDNLNAARAAFHTLRAEGSQRPAIAKVSFPEGTPMERVVVEASVRLGALLLGGFAHGVWIDAPGIAPEKVKSLSLAILQAARRRATKTEYIACPSCGRTLFDLPQALRTVREATSHLPGLKIAVMGCIVNGPGEMADADYGYIGAAPGNVSLYRGKQLVVKNIPAAEALPLLIQMIKDDGRWTEPAE